jgi:replication-associated recombination protein RarA
MLLSRKYSPIELKDFNNNDKLLSIINGMKTIDKFSFVLYGPSGYGKTTLVEIILNEYYNTIPQTERIMRVNILKDNGIAFCRNDMKMFCTRRYVPSLKKNTIVIEDIGFISEQSQNMIKEYIDLYRDRVNFIITSTNNNKIVSGIKSKIPMFNLNPPSKSYIYNLLDKVTTGENISINSDNKSHLLTLMVI